MQNPLVSLLASLVTTFGGSLGCAILALSLCIRVALLPVTIRLARRSLRNQELAKSLQPEIELLKKKFEKKPERIFEEMQKVYKKHNYTPFDLPVLIGGFVQLPLFAIVYGAIQKSLTANSAFLWIRNLASADFMLTLVILALTAASAYWMPLVSENGRTTLIVIQVIVTSVIVWKLAAGLGLYWVASNLVGLFQSVWLRYRLPVAASAA